MGPVPDAPGYVIRSATRTPGGLVSYVLVDHYGRVTNVALRYRDSTAERAAPILARTVAQYPTRPRRP